MIRALRCAAESLFSVLFPSDCRICQAPLTNIASLPVCEPCLARIVPLDGPLCQICGEKLFHPNAEAEDVPLCPICRRVGAHFRRAAAYGAYEGALRDLIHLFKYKGTRPAGKVLGGLLNQAVAAPVQHMEPDQSEEVPVGSGDRSGEYYQEAVPVPSRGWSA